MTPPFKTIRIILIVMFGAPFVLWGIYLVAANAVLKTNVVRNLVNVDPQSVYLDYGNARSFLPGVVTFENLRMRGQDPNVQWVVRIDKGEITVRLSSLLLEHQFRAEHVHGWGVGYRMRMRINPDEVDSPRVAMLPPIVWTNDPPIRPALAPSPPVARDPYRLWTIRLDDIIADNVDELWIEQFRFAGHARVVGSFILKPRLEVQVGPANLVIDRGQLRQGEFPVLTSLRTTLDCTVDRFDAENTALVDTLRFARIALRADADFEDLRFVQTYMPEGAPLAIAGGSGLFSINVDSDHGIIVPGANGTSALNVDLSLENRGISLGYGDATIAMNTRLHTNISRPPGGVQQLEIHPSWFEINSAGIRRGSTSIGSWWGRLDIPEGSVRTEPSEPLQIETTFLGRIRDLNPAFDTLNALSGAPRWLNNALGLGPWSVAGQIRAGGGSLNVNNFRARAGSALLEATFAQRAGSHNLRALVALPPLQLGFEQGNDGFTLHILGASGWFHGK